MTSVIIYADIGVKSGGAGGVTPLDFKTVGGSEGTPAPQLFEKILCILLQFCYLFCRLQ